MIVKDFSLTQVKKFNAGTDVLYDDFIVSYHSRRSLNIRRKGLEGSVTIWDILPFCQCSFIKALKSYNIPFQEELIQKGKSSRRTFSVEDIEELVLPYCVSEVISLKTLAETIREYLRIAELPIRRYDGAGSVAATLMEREKVKLHLWESSEDIQIASKHAYAGGRIEAVQYGHTEYPIYHYDINSAYPYSATKLPSLSHGNWVESDETPTDKTEFAINLVDWKFPSAPAYPFFYRQKSGKIIYPQEGTNWVWNPEVVSAINAGLIDSLSIRKRYVFKPDTENKPFDFIEQLYEQRKIWKSEGVGAEKMLKLGINSVYGKLAQQLGYNFKTGKKPPYHQLEYAGYITSYTRSMLFDAMAMGRGNIIAVATDGIYSLIPLNLTCSDKLGDWEYQKHDSMTIVQSGVYWLDRGEQEQTFYRGFDAGSLQRTDILDAWKNQQRELEVPSTRFIGMSSALMQNPPLRDWCKWVTDERKLTLDMKSFEGKRIDLTDKRLDKGLVLTEPAPNFTPGIISAMHDIVWDRLKSPLTRENDARENDVDDANV
jgi:hypothetical protein